MEKRIGVGLKQGSGPEPGFLWGVEYLTVATAEARSFLDERQYLHVVDQLRALAREEDPTHPATVKVRAVEDCHELKEKGGPLGRINVRVFFHVNKESHTILILGAIKKENDGPTPRATKRLMRIRKRKYMDGE